MHPKHNEQPAEAFNLLFMKDAAMNSSVRFLEFDTDGNVRRVFENGTEKFGAFYIHPADIISAPAPLRIVQAFNLYLYHSVEGNHVRMTVDKDTSIITVFVGGRVVFSEAFVE